MTDETYRPLPASQDAENSLLSSFLQRPLDVGAMCAEIGIEPAWFHAATNQVLFARLMALWAENERIDPITFSQALRNAGELVDVGGVAAITALYGLLPTAANARQYAEIVEEMHSLREIIRVGSEHAGKAYHEHEDPSAAVQAFASAAGSIGTRRTIRKTNKEWISEIVTEMEDRYQHRGAPKDIVSTGYADLDLALGGGLRGDDFILLTGPTKGGKSILAQNIIENIEEAYRRPVLLLTLEMGVKSVLYRSIARRKISMTRMRRGALNEVDFPKIAAAGMQIAASKLIYRDDARSLQAVTAVSRQVKTSHPDLAAIALDYVQLVQHTPASKSANREQVVAEISTACRNLGLELGVPFIILAQENDNGQARESRRLEQDCTARVKLKVPAMADDEPDETYRQVQIPLSRNGSPACFNLTFLGDFSRFENYTEDRSSPAPAPAKKYHRNTRNGNN